MPEEPHQSAPDNGPERDSAASNTNTTTHASQQAALPQRLPAQQRRDVRRPHTPFPIRATSQRDAHRGPADPNPRIGSMHNVGPSLRGPPFPMTRRPIYFPSSLVRHRATSQIMTGTDIASPPVGAKYLQKGRPQKVWRDLIDGNVTRDDQNEKSPRETEAARRLAQHIKEYEERRALFNPPPSRETAPRFRVEKRPFRPHALHTLREQNETPSPHVQLDRSGHRTLRYQPFSYGNTRPVFESDSTPGAPVPPRPVQRQEHPSLLSNADGTAPTMTIDDSVVRSHLFQTDSAPFTFTHQAQQVSYQQAFPITGPTPAQEPQPPYGLAYQEDAPRDADQNVVMSDADESQQVPDGQQASSHPLDSSILDVSMTDAPEIAANQEFVPNPPVEQPAYDPFCCLWNGIYADHIRGSPIFSDPNANPVPGPFPPQGALSNSQFVPAPQAPPFPHTAPNSHVFNVQSPEQRLNIAAPAPATPAIPPILHASHHFATVPALTSPFASNAAQNNDVDIPMFNNTETPLIVRKRRIDQVEEPEQIEHAWSQFPTETSPLVATNANADVPMRDAEPPAEVCKPSYRSIDLVLIKLSDSILLCFHTNRFRFHLRRSATTCLGHSQPLRRDHTVTTTSKWKM